MGPSRVGYVEVLFDNFVYTDINLCYVTNEFIINVNFNLTLELNRKTCVLSIYFLLNR